MSNKPQPKIYVTELSSYNNGMSVGGWIEVYDKDQVWKEIKKIQNDAKKFLNSKGIHDSCEEFAIHDYEDFCGYKIKEYSSIDEVCEVAEFINERSEEEAEAIIGLMGYMGFNKIEEAKDYHDDNYRGSFDSLEDMAMSDVDEGLFGEINESIKNYIDYEKIARDYDIEYITVKLSNDKIAVYYSN